MQTLRSPEYQNRENCPDGGQWNVVLLTKMLGYLGKKIWCHCSMASVNRELNKANALHPPKHKEMG